MSSITQKDFISTELGELPSDWQAVPLKDVVVKGKQRDPRKEPDSHIKYIDVSSISSESLSVIGHNDYLGKNAPSRARKIVHSGDTIFATIRPSLRRVALISEDYNNELCSTAFCVIRPQTDKAYHDYIFYAASQDNFIKRVSEHQRGSSYPAVADKDVLGEFIPLPPLEEQKKIAAVLSTVQEAKEKTEAVITSLKELKKSLMKHLFTYGPVPVEEAENVPLKETEIGQIPEHWKVSTFGDSCQKPQYGFTASSTEKNTGVRFLRITDIQDGKVNWASVPFCECDDVDKYSVSKGDIVVARIGATTGKAFLIQSCPIAVYASYLIRIRPTQSLDTEYLGQLINTELYWSQIDKLKDGRLKQGVNIPNLQSIIIPLPPISEQKSIAEALNSLDIKIKLEQDKLSALDALFKSMLQNLMTGKVRVKDLEIAV